MRTCLLFAVAWMLGCGDDDAGMADVGCADPAGCATNPADDGAGGGAGAPAGAAAGPVADERLAEPATPTGGNEPAGAAGDPMGSEAPVGDGPAMEAEATRVCPALGPPSEDKFNPAELAIASATSGPQGVLVGVVPTGTLEDVACPDPGARSCPQRDANRAEFAQARFESRSCVRALILELGAEVLEEFDFGNALSTVLTWDQMRTVMGHPEVLSMSLADSTTPPP